MIDSLTKELETKNKIIADLKKKDSVSHLNGSNNNNNINGQPQQLMKLQQENHMYKEELGQRQAIIAELKNSNGKVIAYYYYYRERISYSNDSRITSN